MRISEMKSGEREIIVTGIRSASAFEGETQSRVMLVTIESGRVETIYSGDPVLPDFVLPTDFDSDGDVDLIIERSYTHNSKIVWFENNEDSFRRAVMGQGHWVEGLADVDSDGDWEVLANDFWIENRMNAGAR